jgi:hypothetical protein
MTGLYVVTSTTQLAALPGSVPVPADLGVLPTDSVIDVTQIATIDRQTLEERIGSLPDWLLAQLDTGLQRAVGLGALEPLATIVDGSAQVSSRPGKLHLDTIGWCGHSSCINRSTSREGQA